MLTLKQLLESDSLATVVAKLNQNFQVLSNSNGGPQGIRGSQGIPGLPGKMGPIGSTGAAGPTGTILGVIPFAKNNITDPLVGPSVVLTTQYGNVGPWPYSSYIWLDTYHSTATAGEIFIDHRNNGYWKYLTSPDVDGAAFTGYLSGNPYQYPVGNDPVTSSPYVYPNLGPGSSPTVGGQPGFYAGAGWYFYPGQDATTSGAGAVWVEDYTTYLQSALQSGTGPYRVGPFDGSTTSPLKIANARLVTKYGTVWITSGNDATDNNSDGDLKTSVIGKWGKGPGGVDAQPGRYNAGVDRMLFKMSIDGLSYQSNITARGYTGPATMMAPTPSSSEMEASTDYPQDQTGFAFPTNSNKFWPKPQYEITLDKYSPLLFLSHRNDPQSPSDGTYGSLGIYLYTDTTTPATPEYPQPQDPYGAGTLNDNNVSKTIHLFTSRYSPDPMVSWDTDNQPLNSAASLNYGEMVLDFRRVIANNQYVCSLPTDMKLSSDYRGVLFFVGSQVYDENWTINGSPANTNRYKTFQGYISAINGKSISGDNDSPYYWEYGLGSAVPSGTAGTHDLSSGTAGMLTRRTWYGSSVLASQTFNGGAVGANDYIRVAGMLERGRRFQTTAASGGGVGTDRSYFLSELIFYTSQFNLAGGAGGVTGGTLIDNDNVNPNNNEHNSLPSLYVSPFRNIGIGTFVGLTGGADGGPLEPMAKFHVHVKEMDRPNDPTYDYKELTPGSGLYSTLPTKVFTVAAFSGQLNETNNDKRGVTDILLGNVFPTTVELVTPTGNVINQLTTANAFKNAIRTESWGVSDLSTMHFGSSPILNNSSIGKNSVTSYNKEFQISLAPLNTYADDLTTNPLRAYTGVGIHNMFPRARFHMFGKNLYNETEWGLQPWTPTGVSGNPTFSGLSGSYPFYGATATNAPSANQVVIDYIGSSYNYPVGIYEYQYWAFPGTQNIVSSSSPNSAVYPNREKLGITRWIGPYTNVAANSANFAYPVNTSNQAVNYLGSYKHGGTANAFWDPQTYIGFNLFRDLSSASGGNYNAANEKGDNRDDARWMLGTQGATANGHGNNGGAAIISSSQGELGIITIPRGRDGGRAYEQWEQRGLGTRDVLNQMKIVFDKNGNIAIGNAAGWDLDAYPSLNWDMDYGYVNYVPLANATTTGPYSGGTPQAGTQRYGLVNYAGYTENSIISAASLINARATEKEYIRLEVGAEKAWSRDGRMLEKTGWGYPPNQTIVISGATLDRYVKINYASMPPSYVPTSPSAVWTLTTDDEGRIADNNLIVNINDVQTSSYNLDPVTIDDFTTVVFPHPTEFNSGLPLNGLISTSTFKAPAGAIAAEWAGMVIENLTLNYKGQVYGIASGGITTSVEVSFPSTFDNRGSANVRLNNFVYGEGFGISSGTQGGFNNPFEVTRLMVQLKRQESPKLILSFLEKTPTTGRTISGTTPYLKVNTVIQSAQNETSLREYWIPKAANTGGTFMVFTDFLGQKEKQSSFNQTPINNTGLFVEEVVTQEFLAGYTTFLKETVMVTGEIGNSIYTATPVAGFPRLDYDVPLYNFYNNKPSSGTGSEYKYNAITPINLYPGYVRYFNKAYNKPNATAYFTNTQFGEIVPTYDLGPANVALKTIAQTQADPIKHYTTFRLYPTSLATSTANIYNEPMYMYFGTNSSTLTAQQIGIELLLTQFNYYLAEDSELSTGTLPSTQLTDVPGTIVTKVNTNPGNSTNKDYSIFRRNAPDSPFGQNPQGVKVTIRIKARTSGALYANAQTLGARLMYQSGNTTGYGEYGIEAFREGLKSNSVGSTLSGNDQPAGDPPRYMTLASNTNKLLAEFEIINSETFGVIDSEDHIYMDWAQWQTREAWAVCFAYIGPGTVEVPVTTASWSLGPYAVSRSGSRPFYPLGGWYIELYEVKFEYCWPEAGTGLTDFNKTVGVAANGTVPFANNASSIRRNIDKYYEIYKPTFSTQPEFGNDAGDNQATQIRVKRINSEYALVDYNITVKVNNPNVVDSRRGDPAAYIDFCSPRFTQYLRFVYIPDASGSAGSSKRLYDDDLSLINWSTYKNWLPGTAIVGDDMFGDGASTGSTVAEASEYNFGPTVGDKGKLIRAMTNDWSPFFNDQITQENGSNPEYLTTPMTWNGNILESVAYAAYYTNYYFVEESVGKGNTRFSTLTRPLRSFYSVASPGGGGFTANGASEDYMRNTAYAAFGSDVRILANAYHLFQHTRGTDGVINAKNSVNPNIAAAKQLGFVGYLGSMYALYKNESFLRNKNTQWRILPAQPYLAGDSGSAATNRSFYLEVQLSTPILHCDTPFGGYFYGQKVGDADVTPYRYLTLNGQAIVKFKETEEFDRPLAEVGDPSYSGGGFPPQPPNPPGPAGGEEEDLFNGGFGPAGGGNAFDPNEGGNQNQGPGLGPNVA